MVSAFMIRLVILSFYLEVRLRMVANGTYIRSLLANNDVAAVAALPDDITILREDALLADIV